MSPRDGRSCYQHRLTGYLPQSAEGRRIELDQATARWLTGAAGQAAVAELTAAVDAGEDPLRLAAGARRSLDEPRHAAAATAAAVARVRARSRWPEAETLLFTREGLEEASDPEVAAWRARSLVARTGQPKPCVVDLTAGLGGDALALAGAGVDLTAVEADPARAVLLAHNLAACGASARVVVDDALAVRVPSHGYALADPSRRVDGRRVRQLDAHRPPVGPLVQRQAEHGGLALVLAPGVDRDDPAFDARGIEVEYVQLGDQLLEATVWFERLRDAKVEASATLLPAGDHRTRTTRGERLPVREPGGYLIEVAPAAVRARLHDDVGREIDAWRLASHRALLSADRRPPTSAWYRARPIEATLPARAAPLRRWLAERDELPVEVVTHGLDADPARWWRELGRPPRGPQGRRIELIRRDADTIAVITDARPRP